MSNLEEPAAGDSTKSMGRSCGEPLNNARSSNCNSSLPNKIKEKKLLVLDLDETLVHTVIQSEETCDFSFTTIDKCTYYIKKRPYVEDFLKRASELFDVVIFTASDHMYADPVLDFLDPQHKLIVERYYYDSVEYLPDGNVKDLNIFGVDLAKVILIDNCPANFRWQKDNGIPIVSWYSDPQDEELATLLPFLEKLAAAEDVRPIIARRFACCKVE
ncbi:hypothetical protein MKX03_011221 [Papaver bracteatum]|nr:hypothetical protein MKX03_011221 [Papaver bracteatum]